MIQFGLKDLSELPTLKEFEEIKRLAMGDESEPPAELAGSAAASSDLSSEHLSETGSPEEGSSGEV
jgi:segregation and condensation protein B